MFTRAFVTGFVGMLAGASAGALTFAWDISMDVGTSWIGANRNFWPYGALYGAFMGAMFGGPLGILINIAGVGLRAAAIVGSLVGMIGAVWLWWMTSDMEAQSRPLPALIAPRILSVVLWVLVGLVSGVVSSAVRKAGWE